MIDDEPDTSDPDDAWGRRRGNLRHEVSVPAVLIDRLGTRVRCRIEDISSTGMALAIELFTPTPGQEPLLQGTDAVLEFNPDPDDSGAGVSVPVRIMWRAPVALGVHFLEMTPAFRQALKQVARAAVDARTRGDHGGRTMTAEQRRVMQACRKTLQKQLPNLIWVLRTELAKTLRLMAESAAPADARAAREDAAEVEQKALALSRAIEHQVLSNFAEASDLEETQELTLMQIKATREGEETIGARLRLMNDPAAENASRVTSVAQIIDERYKADFFELNVRMANVVGRQLDVKSNPLVPGILCRIFWYGVTSYVDSKRVEQALQHVLQKRVMPLLGDLYGAVSETLDSFGAKRYFDVRRDDPFRGA